MWLEQCGVSSDTISTIGKFSILWCGFEQFAFSMNIDSNKIIDWANCYADDTELLSLCELVRSSAVEYLGDTSELTIKSRLFSVENKGKPEFIRLIGNFLNKTDCESVLLGCLLFIQRIRNNLFHGLKDVYTLNDQRQMFIEICNLLDYVLRKGYY